jgi:hypothetical protein
VALFFLLRLCTKKILNIYQKTELFNALSFMASFLIAVISSQANWDNPLLPAPIPCDIFIW